jgi:hypothetical protein
LKACRWQHAAIAEQAPCTAAGTLQAKRWVCALQHFLQLLPLVKLLLCLSLTAAAVASWWQGNRHHTKVERLGICFPWQRPQGCLLLLRQHTLLLLLPISSQRRCFWEAAARQPPEGALAWQPIVSIPSQLLLVERWFACFIY